MTKEIPSYFEDTLQRQTICVLNSGNGAAITPLMNFFCRVVGYEHDRANDQLVYVLAGRDADGKPFIGRIYAYDFFHEEAVAAYFSDDNTRIFPGQGLRAAAAIWSLTFQRQPLPSSDFEVRAVPTNQGPDDSEESKACAVPPRPPLQPCHISYQLPPTPKKRPAPDQPDLLFGDSHETSARKVFIESDEKDFSLVPTITTASGKPPHREVTNPTIYSLGFMPGSSAYGSNH
jgi:hypothetical protein